MKTIKKIILVEREGELKFFFFVVYYYYNNIRA